RKMPPVKDKQSKDDLFEAIQKKSKERHETEKIVVPKRRKTWIYPVIATAAAMLLIILILPSFFNDFDIASEEDSSFDRAADYDMDDAGTEVAEDTEDASGEMGTLMIDP
ncbi:hypothetical protein, partial [Pseudomonas sp. 2995-1]|uniref:hypothetical protein n=1 Tax=Pseudomonas sp. 2995-1 TaxID=1712679 RepID=UPI001C47DACB